MKKIYVLLTSLILSISPLLAQTGLTCNNAVPETANSTCNYTPIKPTEQNFGLILPPQAKT